MSFLSKLGMMVGSKASNAATSATTKTPRNPSSAIAKERLSVILASQRGSELLQNVNMEELQKDVLDVVRRHINAVSQNSPVHCQMKNDGEVNLFEMSVEIDSCASRNNINSRAGMIRPATVTLNASTT